MKSSISLFCWLTAIACLPSCAEKARPSAARPEAADLALTWELLSNQVAGQPRYRSAFTIYNKGRQPLGDAGWAIYFNQITRRIIPGSMQGPAVVEQLNGDFYRLRPTEGFWLPPGDSLTIAFDGEDWIIKMLDGPLGPYIVFTDEQGGGEEITPIVNFRVKPFTRPDQATRFSTSIDKTPLPDPAWRFEQNARLSLLPEGQVPRIIPRPLQISPLAGMLRFDGRFSIFFGDDDLEEEASFLSGALAALLPSAPAVEAGAPPSGTPAVTLSLGAIPGMRSRAEAYALDVSESGIRIEGSDAAGVFYGIQSLLSLLPPAASAGKREALDIQACRVVDAPRFGYRGMHLDVARNFNGKPAVKKLLDAMAFYKLNAFQIRLSDDEGWRLAIEELPELTEVGAFRGHTLGDKDFLPPAFGSGPFPEAGSGYGSGYYTRADFKEIIRYAHDRHIQVVPEICVPSHARAAIKAMELRYRRLMDQGDETAALAYLLSDFDDESEYLSAQHYTDNIICVCRESAVRFYETVIDDIREMFEEAGVPLRKIHIGGDEVPDGAWTASPVCEAYMADREDLDEPAGLFYDYRRKVIGLLETRGLEVGGWEEVALKTAGVEGYVPDPEYIGRPVHPYVWNNLWGNQDLGYRLANAGYDVVLCPVTNFYFDLAYSKEPEEPGLYWGGFGSTRQAFEFNPFDVFLSTTTDEMGNRFDPERDYRRMERLQPEARRRVLGLQGQLWSETIKGAEMLEYYYFPKMLGLAERAWSPPPPWEPLQDRQAYDRALDAGWNAFANALGQRELPRLDHLFGGFNYRLPPPGARVINGKLHANVAFPGLTIRYTTDGSEPDARSPVYEKPFELTSQANLKTFDQRGRGSRTSRVIRPVRD